MSRIPPELEAEMTPAVKAAFLALLDRIDQLEALVQKLTPRNSSLPPSTEHPHAKPARSEPKAPRRKPGGQKGHKRHLRQLVPTAQCTTVTPCVPHACRCCGGELEPDSSAPERHQVWELPPIEPIITEYQRYRGYCAGCGITTLAPLPEGVPNGQCGPRLAAFTGLLMGHFRQSKRRTAAFLGDLLHVPASAAWVVKIQQRVSDAITAPYEQLRDRLKDERQLFVDESPTKQKDQKAWLWVAVAPLYAVFGIFANRSRQSLQALVGNYQEIIINCDRAKMYLDAKRLQWCWAHLKRDFQKLMDSPDGPARCLGRDLMRQERALFKHWRHYKAGKLKWSSFVSYGRPIRRKVEGLLLRGAMSGNPQMVGICEELYERRAHLWTFTREQGIEPTNNTAERALRPAVIYRKLSFGTQSAGGSRYLERILTISETCRLQNRNVYAYLVAAMQAKFAGEPAPSLLPSAHQSTVAVA